MEWQEPNSCGSRLGHVAGSSEHDSKTSGSTKCGDFLGQPRTQACWLLKNTVLRGGSQLVSHSVSRSVSPKSQPVSQSKQSVSQSKQSVRQSKQSACQSVSQSVQTVSQPVIQSVQTASLSVSQSVSPNSQSASQSKQSVSQSVQTVSQSLSELHLSCLSRQTGFVHPSRIKDRVSFIVIGLPLYWLTVQTVFTV